MSQSNLLSQLEALISPIVETNGCKLWDLEYVKEGSNKYLRIFIEKDEPVSINDCEAVSRAVEKVLDEKDPIPEAYILEVSSPGLDRPLKKDSDFVRFVGHIVDVRLYKPVSMPHKPGDKSKNFQGKLLGLVDGCIEIEDESGKTLSFAREDVAICRLAVIL